MVSKSKPEASYASTRLTKSNYNGPGLLRQVNGRTRDTTPKNYKIDSSEDEEDTCSTHKPAPKKTEEAANSGKVEDEPATDDEPLSSSDESDRSTIDAMLDLTGRTFGNSKVNRTDVNPTTAQEKESQATNKQEKGKGASKGQPRQGTRKSSRHGTAPATSPKRTASEMMSGGGDDEDDELSFSLFTVSQKSKRRKPTVYGSNSNRIKSNIHTSDEFKHPSSPDVLGLSPKEDSPAGFKNPGDLPPPRSISAKKDDAERGFQVPRPFDVPTPKAKNPPPSKLKHGFHESDKPTFYMPPSSFGDSDAPIHSSQMTGAGSEFKNPAALPNDTISSSSLTTSSSKGGPIFDFSLGDDDDDSPVSPLSSVGSTCSHDLSQEEKAFLASDNRKPKQIECPMCGGPVDAEFLEEFSVGRKLKVRQQNQFCREHRKRSAELVWAEKGYPQIDWGSFHKRVRRHFPALEQFMAVGKESKSYFRNALDSNIKSKGESRLTMEGDSLEMISAGYYGSKGSRRM
jgi:hypothetical protein